ncbi:SatD family protein [Schaalia vaccimaxillae]|uniref:SatD family protein n=1 Tax=Schaalia vaccimaxillae TaxID=183916 RepID=UPI0003B79CC3|nr:SatD family protein [Schaalia vaccimaxillae]
MAYSYAILADIINSRELDDRNAAQESFLSVLEEATKSLKILQQPYATVGDEFQTVCSSLEDALDFTLRVQLLLPLDLGLRFGIGEGDIKTIPTQHTPIQDGSAWWRAREAIDNAHETQKHLRFTRTRAACADPQRTAHTNALLTLRDQTVSRLQERPRRIIAAALVGTTQIAIARKEGITQAAVSSVVNGSGAALLEAQRLLLQGTLQPLSGSE